MRSSSLPIFFSLVLVLVISCVQVVNPTPQPVETFDAVEATADVLLPVEVVPTPTIESLPTPTEIAPTVFAVTDRPEISIADLVERARESVVRIDVTSVDGTGTGTGFAYSEDLILTNAHVVEGVENAEVSLRISEGVQPKKFNAVVLGRDENNDLAVLRVTGASFNALELGNSSDASVGTEVLAIGFPLGLDGDMSVTRGIVSRKLDSDGLNLIQHDAKILPGNSGGPLLTMDGTVVGINAAVVGDVSGKSGETLNFAIAIEEAERRLTSLENGSVDAATDRTFVSSTYGHSFDIPDGWFLIEESDESVYTYDEETRGFVSINIDPDLSMFPSGQLWADYFYLAGVTYVDGDSYELIDEQVTHNPDGSVEWYFLERFQRPGDDFMSLGGESFTYDDGLGIRAYIEAPEDSFDAAFLGMNQVLESFHKPTISTPGKPDEIERDCGTISTDYTGSIRNISIGITSPASFLFSQTKCDLLGLFFIEDENLVGSGAFIGYLDDSNIKITVLGITNDAGVDIEFSGLVSTNGIQGTYSVPKYDQDGQWNVTSSDSLVVAPTAIPTPRPTETPLPTATPTPWVIPTSTPKPEPIDPSQDSWYKSGLLTHEPDDGNIESESASVNLQNFIAQAIFTNPFDGGWQSSTKWDYGFFFHKALPSGGLFDAVVVRSDGTWEHRSGNSPPYDVIDSGYLNNLNTDARATNELELIAQGNEALFAVNGKQITTLRTGGTYRQGDVEVFTGFFTGDEKTGAVTEYSDFRVQALNETVPYSESGEFVKKPTQYAADSVTCSTGGIIEVTFINPIQTHPSATWDYGIQIARSGDYFDFVNVSSDRRWRVRRRTGNVESASTTASGFLSYLNVANLAENEIRVIFSGDNGWLSVNGRAIGSFPLRTDGYNCHSIASGFFTGGTETDSITKYKNVSTWEVYVDPNQGRPVIAPTPIATSLPTPTQTPQPITTPSSTTFDINVRQGVGGIPGNTHSQNRLPTFVVEVAPNQSLNQAPYVQLMVDVEEDQTFAFQQDLLGTLEGDVWKYSYTFSRVIPFDNSAPFSGDQEAEIRWKVLVRAGNIGSIVEKTSDEFILNVDQQIPWLEAGQELPAVYNLNGKLGTLVAVKWDGPIDRSSLSLSDLNLETDNAIYVPLEMSTSDFSDEWVNLLFDRVIDDVGTWTVTIQGVVRDLAGNSTDAGSVVISH